jgi:hypothetical protein
MKPARFSVLVTLVLLTCGCHRASMAGGEPCVIVIDLAKRSGTQQSAQRPGSMGIARRCQPSGSGTKTPGSHADGAGVAMV